MSPARVVVAVLRLMVGPEIGVRRQIIVAAMLEGAGLALSVAGPYSLKLLVDGLSGSTGLVALVVLVAIFVLASAGSNLVASLRMVRVQRIVDAVHAFLVRRLVVDRLSSETAAREGNSAEAASMLERLPFSLQIVIDGLLWRVAPIALQVVLCLAVVGASVPGRYVLLLALVLTGYGASTWSGMRRHRVHADAMNKLPGGQIQKLELARLAGIATPAVILDESTSALDPQAEALILADLRRRFSARSTLIVVSHRPGVAALADKVVFVEDGRLRAQGAHRVLLESDDHYRLLCQGLADAAAK
jgi:ABC-type multidrug transport system fused ATPase/permease subunit